MKNKVVFFKRIVDFFFRHTKLIFGIIAIAIAFTLFPMIRAKIQILCVDNQMTLSTFLQDIISGAIVTLIPMIYALIAHIFKQWNHVVSFVKRMLYRNCLRMVHSEHMPRIVQKIASTIIHVFYFQERELLFTQQRIVNQILETLNTSYDSPSGSLVFWIQGSPYSGKTTTILNLLVDLISKQEFSTLFERLDRRIIYVDLGRDDIQLDCLLEEYRGGKYEKCLITIDNLHKISGENCVRFINEVVVSLHAYAIIVLMRRPEDFLCDSERIVFLNDTISEIGSLYTLDPISPSDLQLYRNHAFWDFCNRFGLNNLSDNETIVHLSSLFKRKNFEKDNLLTQLCRFASGDYGDDCIAKKLTAIIATSVFTGSFSIATLRVCINLSQKTWRHFLNQLLQMGFLASYPHLSNDYYYFHESVAKFYCRHNFGDLFFQKLYYQYFEKLYYYYKKQNNNLLSFLYGVLLEKDCSCLQVFDKVLINSNFTNLYRELNFLLSLDEKQRRYYDRELGMLCDRMGKLSDAKKYYFSYLSKTNSPDALYKLIQIDHSYIEKYPQIIQSAMEHSDIYYQFLAKYWALHVKMHQGNFQFKELKALLLRYQNYSKEMLNKHVYDGIHLLRRGYFDCFRLYYLEGMLKPDELAFLMTQDNDIKHLLQTNLDEFDAYYTKFALGQFLIYDVLFALAFLNQGIVTKQYYSSFLQDEINLRWNDMHDFKKVAKEAVIQLQKSAGQLERAGDKTSMFVRYHMYNAKLCLIEDGNYSEFDQFYEEYMGFATREKDAEYQSYAELFKLKTLLVKMTAPAVIFNDPNYNYIMIQFEERFRGCRAYQQLGNPDFTNEYAELRLDFLNAIFEFLTKRLSNNQFREKILRLKARARENGYQRELQVFEYIKHCEYRPSMEHLRIIVTYYPIITQ